MHICTRKTVKTTCNKEDFVAQLVEQLTLNQWVEGSSPSEVTENKPLTRVGGFLFGVKLKCFYPKVKPRVKPKNKGHIFWGWYKMEL